VIRLLPYKWEFTSPVQTDPPIIIRAYSEQRAWAKFESWCVLEMYGRWCFFYDADKVRKVMAKVTCRKLEGNDNAG